MSSDRARELRKQGIAAAKAGQKDEARKLLQQALKLEPRNEAAWLWLLSVARDQRERMFFLNRLLEINPSNDMALQSLQSLGLTREQLSEQVASMPAQQPAAKPAQAAVSLPEPDPEASAVPFINPKRLAELYPEVDSIVNDYLSPSEGYPGIKWVHKTRQRAGERDALVLRAYVIGGVAGLVVVLLILGWTVVLNTPALRGIVFVPTPTLTRTPIPPTVTFTPTAGVTPTPSPTPALTYTPSATVPPQIPNGSSGFAQATEIYPPALERGIRDSVSLMDRGDYGEAVPTLVVEITRVASSFDASPYYFGALALAGDGDLDGASNLLADGEKRLPEKPNETRFGAMISAGQAYIDLLRAQQAISEGNRDQVDTYVANIEDRALTAIGQDPRLDLSYLALASAYRLENDYDRAIGVLDRGLSVAELAGNVKLLVEKGEIYFAKQEYDQAAYQAFVALYVDPYTERAHVLQVDTALAQDNAGLAVLYAQAYLFYFPGSVDGYRLLGDARVKEGNTDLALEAYSQALTGGDNADVLVSRAALYTSQRRYDLARDDLTKALTLKDDPQIRAQRMLAAFSAGNTATASSDAEALLGTGVLPDSQIKLLQARILIDDARQGDTADSETALNMLTDLGEDLPTALQSVADEYRARALYNLGTYDQALTLINGALAVTETGSRHYLRGLILEAQGDTDGALREYDWVASLSEIYPYPFLPDVRARMEQLAAGSGS